MKRFVSSLVLVSTTYAGWASAQEEPVLASPEPAALPAPTAVQPAPDVAAPAVAAPAVAAPAVAAPAVAPQPSEAPIPLTSLPPTQRYRAYEAPPPGYVLEEQARRALVIPGVAVVGALYITGVITTGVLQDFPNKTGFLAIPVAGPWITLVTRDASCDDDVTFDCEEDDAVKRLLVLDGLVQAIGTALIVTGFTWTKSVWVREDLANISLVPGVNVARVPGMPEAHGLSLVGQF
jgi:hypothetical protein